MAGGTILAVTGGLAAPALAAGLLSSGALIGGAVGSNNELYYFFVFLSLVVRLIPVVLL